MPIEPPPMEVADAARLVGERIRIARIRRRMSQAELALACGVTRKTIYALERNAAGTTLVNVLSALWKLGLLDTVARVADPDGDEHGRILEAARRAQRARQSAARDNDF